MQENKKEGIILINKPKGITSHDVVDIVRKKLNTKRVGHSGTLDPLAEGLLIILVGEATKLFPRFADFDKEYAGILKLGEITTTGDCQGDTVKVSGYIHIGEERIREVFSFFKGEIQQVPPMVSAIRVGGSRLYKLARKGIVIARKPRPIRIHSLEIRKVDLPFIEFYVHCSKGTYVRKLAEDIGESLGCGAHIVKINRLSVGPFKLDKAVGIDSIDESNLQKITF